MAPPATVRGPTFIRLLARLAGAGVPPPGQPLPERLGQWLDWKHALSLAAALDTAPIASETDAPPPGDLHGECGRAREALVAAIRNDPLLVPGAPVPDEPDYGPFRQAYLARQRAMQATVGRLRGKLRDALGQPSPETVDTSRRHHSRESGNPGGGSAKAKMDSRFRGNDAHGATTGNVPMAQLAEVDAAMEAALTPREHNLLANVPDLLGRRFERLCAEAPASSTWLDGFRRDMQSVLLAELDLRFQPVDALLAALRSP